MWLTRQARAWLAECTTLLQPRRSSKKASTLVPACVPFLSRCHNPSLNALHKLTQHRWSMDRGGWECKNILAGTCLYPVPNGMQGLQSGVSLLRAAHMRHQAGLQGPLALSLPRLCCCPQSFAAKGLSSC